MQVTVVVNIIPEPSQFCTDGSSDEYIPSENNSSEDSYYEERDSNKEKVTEVKRKIFEIDKNIDPQSQRVNKKKKVFELKEKTSRKRMRNPEEWKRKKAAVDRQKGKSYISQSGKLMPEKRVKLDNLCPENCKLKCNQNFEEHARINIFDKYHQLDQNSKNVLLFKNIILQEVKRHRVGAIKKKKHSFKYVIFYNHKQIPCCKRALCSLYQFSHKKVELIQRKLKAGESAPTPDKRGRHSNRPHKIPDIVVEKVVSHIKKFPAESSHYSRNKNIHKMFLSPLLNVRTMHKLYIEECEKERLPSTFFITGCSYRAIFERKFNLSFGIPKSDTCSTCDAGNHTAEHEENYKTAFAQQKRDRVTASEDSKVCYLTLDLQQTMPLPKLSTSKAFYLRQMWFYNLGIHTIRNTGHKTFFFTWTEEMANRGSSEIASCLHTFCQIYNEYFQEKIDHIIIWSDSCSGQNKNFNMIALYQLLVLKGDFKVIDHKFPEVGHSYLDSDRDFGRIEKLLRKHENIYVPDQYREILRTPKDTVVVDMKNHFKDIDEISSKLNLYNRKKNVNNEKVYFRDGIKWIRVDSYGCYYYKTTLDEMTPFYKVDILKKQRTNEINPDNIALTVFNENKGSISVEKLANLKEQLPFIKEEYRPYYQNILGNDQPVVENRRTI